MKLIGKYRSDSEASRETGINRSLISQIRTGIKKIGDRKASQIEEIFGLPYRSLDYPDMKVPVADEEALQADEPEMDMEIVATIRELPREVRLPLELALRSIANKIRECEQPKIFRQRAKTTA